jgi:hypothetical protein
MMTASTETAPLSGKDRVCAETGTISPAVVKVTSAEVTLISTSAERRLRSLL